MSKLVRFALLIKLKLAILYLGPYKLVIGIGVQQ
jgi:hypothetical protein